MLLFCARTVVKESHNYDLAHLRTEKEDRRRRRRREEKEEKEKKKEGGEGERKHNGRLETLWFGTFTVFSCYYRRVKVMKHSKR